MAGNEFAARNKAKLAEYEMQDDVMFFFFFFFFAAPLSLDASVLRFVAFRESKRDFWLSSGNYYSEKLKTLRTHHRESVMRGYLLTTYANLLWMLTDCNLCVIIFFS